MQFNLTILWWPLLCLAPISRFNTIRLNLRFFFVFKMNWKSIFVDFLEAFWVLSILIFWINQNKIMCRACQLFSSMGPLSFSLHFFFHCHWQMQFFIIWIDGKFFLSSFFRLVSSIYHLPSILDYWSAAAIPLN